MTGSLRRSDSEGNGPIPGCDASMRSVADGLINNPERKTLIKILGLNLGIAGKDMQQVIVVNHQDVMATEIVIRNNKELMRGVEGDQNVTINALRTSVTVAGALYNQKIVLKKIEMLNETTSNIIASTTRALKSQGADIQNRSMQANISLPRR